MSNILFTRTNTRLLRLLAVAGTAEVNSISRALDMKPAHVRRQLWILSRRGFVHRTGPISNGNHWRYTADRGHVDNGLTAALLDLSAGPE